jgi:hypothetical protein
MSSLNTLPQSNALPQSLLQLPGVGSTTGATATSGTSAAGGAQAMVYEGSGSGSSAEFRTETRRLEFAADLKNNVKLAEALVQQGMPTDARGLADVSGKAAKHAKEFTDLVNAAKDVNLSKGKNPVANQRYEDALKKFTEVSGLTKNQLGDLMYIIMRVGTAEAGKDIADVRNRLMKQIGAISKLMEALRAYEKEIQNAIANANPGDGKTPPTVSLAESDFRLNLAGDVERIRDANPNTTYIKASDNVSDLERPADHDRQHHAAIHEALGFKDSPFSRKERKILVMTVDGAQAELKETRDQLKNLEKTNKDLRSMLQRMDTSKTPITFDPLVLMRSANEAFGPTEAR